MSLLKDVSPEAPKQASNQLLSRTKIPELKSSNGILTKNNFRVGGGPHSTMDSVLASQPAAPGSNLGSVVLFRCCRVNQLQYTAWNKKGQWNKLNS